MRTANTTKAVSVPTESSYEGHPTLVLPNPDDPTKPGISFGARKLRAVLAHLAEVKAFVANGDVNAVIASLRSSGKSAEEILATLLSK
jgi:hypothetical protein